MVGETKFVKKTFISPLKKHHYLYTMVYTVGYKIIYRYQTIKKAERKLSAF